MKIKVCSIVLGLALTMVGREARGGPKFRHGQRGREDPDEFWCRATVPGPNDGENRRRSQGHVPLCESNRLPKRFPKSKLPSGNLHSFPTLPSSMTGKTWKNLWRLPGIYEQQALSTQGKPNAFWKPYSASSQSSENGIQSTRQIDEIDITFHPLKAGRLKRKSANEIIEVELPHDIEVMSSPVTQRQYDLVVGKNVPSTTVTLRNDSAKQASLWQAFTFANQLSIEHGLEPAYDLTEVRWEARGGTLKMSEGSRIKINAPEGDIYRAERLSPPHESGTRVYDRNRKGGKNRAL